MAKGGYYSRVPIGANLNEIGVVGAQNRHLGSSSVSTRKVRTANILGVNIGAVNDVGFIDETQTLAPGASHRFANAYLFIPESVIGLKIIGANVTIEIDGFLLDETNFDKLRVLVLPRYTRLDVLVKNEDSSQHQVTVKADTLYIDEPES